MRVGVFGGSFDPVHLGHMALAACCRDQAGLDRVVFVPAAHQPHKPKPPRASGEQRVDMLRLATESMPEATIATIELDRGGASYTIDTLREMKRHWPDATMYFLMGADSLADLPRWREPAAICELAAPVVVHRAGTAPPDFAAIAPLVSPERLEEIRSLEVEMPPTPISSSEIQRLITEGGEWQSLVPPAVARYIAAHRLYGA